MADAGPPGSVCDRLPFATLNLRWNPFGEPAVEDRGRLWVDGEQDWLGRAKAIIRRSLAADHHSEAGRSVPSALQLLGPPGSGKTTLLHALRDEFPGASTVAWSQTSGWSCLPAGEPLFVDDGHLLPWRLFRKVVRRRALVVATQTDLSRRLGKKGYEVSTIQAAGVLGQEGLRRLVDRRLEWARRSPGSVPRIPDSDLNALAELHGTNLRALIWDLYQVIQTREASE